MAAVYPAGPLPTMITSRMSSVLINSFTGSWCKCGVTLPPLNRDTGYQYSEACSAPRRGRGPLVSLDQATNPKLLQRFLRSLVQFRLRCMTEQPAEEGGVPGAQQSRRHRVPTRAFLALHDQPVAGSATGEVLGHSLHLRAVHGMEAAEAPDGELRTLDHQEGPSPNPDRDDETGPEQRDQHRQADPVIAAGQAQQQDHHDGPGRAERDRPPPVGGRFERSGHVSRYCDTATSLMPPR